MTITTWNIPSISEKYVSLVIEDPVIKNTKILYEKASKFGFILTEDQPNEQFIGIIKISKHVDYAYESFTEEINYEKNVYITGINIMQNCLSEQNFLSEIDNYFDRLNNVLFLLTKEFINSLPVPEQGNLICYPNTNDNPLKLINLCGGDEYMFGIYNKEDLKSDWFSWKIGSNDDDIHRIIIQGSYLEIWVWGN